MVQGYQPAPAADKDPLASAAPPGTAMGVRGSRYQPVFPAAIAAIWKRPGSALIEIAWRWLGSLPLLLFASHLWMTCGAGLQAIAAPLSSLTFFKPVESAEALGGALAAALALLRPHLMPWLPLCLAAWLLASALGRTAVLRLLGRRIQPAASAGKKAAGAPLEYRPLGLLLLTALRAGLLSSLYVLWIGVTLVAGRSTVTDPASRNGEPHIVLFAALAVGAALLLFALWCVVSWPLQLAQFLLLRPAAGFAASLREAAHLPKRLRNELVEVNLVMGIVRLALLILLMVLSACPLPFQNVETTGFLIVWNMVAVVLWLVASDFFHTVRQAIVLRLVRTWSTLLDA